MYSKPRTAQDFAQGSLPPYNIDNHCQVSRSTRPHNFTPKAQISLLKDLSQKLQHSWFMASRFYPFPSLLQKFERDHHSLTKVVHISLKALLKWHIKIQQPKAGAFTNYLKRTFIKRPIPCCINYTLLDMAILIKKLHRCTSCRCTLMTKISQTE